MRVLATLLTLALAAVTLACGLSSSSRAPLVILIIVDTLRAQSLPSYGYDRDTAPFLERFADANLLFENVHSQASCTFPSVNSILTSRYPAEFLIEPIAIMGARPDLPTVGEFFRQEGYDTVGISASPVVRATPNQYDPTGVFGAGFDRFLEACVHEPAACVNRQALEVIAAAEKPTFLYLHYFDPHDPYSPPAAYERQFALPETAAEVREWAAAGRPNWLAEAIDGHTEMIEYGDIDLQHLNDLYDDEIRYLDGQIELLFEGLERLGRSEDAIVAIGSDHGEQFLEHGQLKHCKSVHEAESRVPLLMAIPGVQPRRIRRAVQNLDITPTLLDAAGLRWRGRDLSGQSLLPLVSGSDVPGGQAYSLQGSQRALSADRYKLLLDIETQEFRLYDLAEDPIERDNLAPTEPELLDEMTLRLRALVAQAESVTGDPARVSRLLRQAESRLRALGYLR